MINCAKKIRLNNICCNQYTEVIHNFDAVSGCDTELFVCSETEYVVYINSSFAGTGQYKTFDGRLVYDSYDVSALVNEGKNQIRIISYHQGENSSIYAQKEPYLIFSLAQNGKSLAVSGEDCMIRPYVKYRNSEVEMITKQLGYAYHYDANTPDAPWEKPVVSDITETTEARPVKKLVHMPLQQGEIITQGHVLRTTQGTTAEMMQHDFLAFAPKDEIFCGTTVRKSENGVYFIIDLQKEYAGFFDMDITASKDTVINIGYGEHLDDMRVRTSVGGRNFACSYVCSEGRQQFSGYFRRFAARYIQIHIFDMSGDVDIHRMGIVPTEYPLSNEAHFKCDNLFFNRLFDVSVNTLKLCMHEHYEDCPWREQALYAFDSYVQMLCGYYAFGEYEFPRQSLRLLADGIREDGLLEMCAPGHPDRNIPSFSLCWIISLQKYVLYSGDIDFAREYLGVADRILGFFDIRDGIVYNDNVKPYWHFYEWIPGIDGEEEYYETDSLINFYYIMACESYNLMCEYLGISPKYDCTQMKIKVKEKFYNKDEGIYITAADCPRYHELTQSLALLAGVGCDELADILVRGDERLEQVSLSASVYKYEAVLQNNIAHLDGVIEQIYNIWGKMIYSGCETLWETSVGADDFCYAGSLCHAWSAVPVYVIYKYALGYEPLSPGFGKYKKSANDNSYIKSADAAYYCPDKSSKGEN